MIETPQHPRSRLGLLAAGLVSVALLTGTRVPSQKPCPVSGDVPTLLRDLESALIAGDAGQIAANGTELAGRGRAAAARQQAAGGAPPPWAGLAADLADAATAAAAHADAGNLPGAGSAAARATRTCVLCHVQSRDGEKGPQPFPARGNTIWGRVSIQDLGGDPREDRSGVVVFVDNVAGAVEPAYPVASARVSQQGRRFSPPVLPIVLGSSIEFPNDDTIFHNAFSLSKTHPFDLGIYPRGEVKSVRPTRLGLINVYCNIHAEMKCAILVLQNPCFGVTDAAGVYVITGVPDGQHTLRTWHEFGGETSQRIAVAGSTAVRVDHGIRETKKLASHLDKWGKPMRPKY